MDGTGGCGCEAAADSACGTADVVVGVADVAGSSEVTSLAVSLVAGSALVFAGADARFGALELAGLSS